MYPVFERKDRMKQISINSLTKEELTQQLKEMQEPAFRAGQIYDWLHVKHVSSYDQMLNVPKQLREKLAAQYNLTVLKQVEVLCSEIDGTRKS